MPPDVDDLAQLRPYQPGATLTRDLGTLHPHITHGLTGAGLTGHGWETKAARRIVGRGRFDSDVHPRDQKGRFIETGAEVQIWGGRTGTVEKNIGGGFLQVRMKDGSVQRIHRNYLTVEQRPDGSKPSGAAFGAKPKAMPVEKPDADATEFAATGDTRIPVKDLKAGQAVLIHGRNLEGGRTSRVGVVEKVKQRANGDHVVSLAEVGDIYTEGDGVARLIPAEKLQALIEATRKGDDPAAKQLVKDIQAEILAADDDEFNNPAPPAPDARSTPAAPATAVPAGAQDVESRIRDAYAQLAEPDAWGDASWVSLTKLRESLSDLPRAEVDEALRQMNRMPDVNIAPENDQAALTREDRAAAVRLGDQDKHLLMIEGVRPGAKPAPQPGKPAAASDASKTGKPVPATPETVVPGDITPGDRVTFDIPVTAANAARFDTPGAKNPPKPGTVITVRGVVEAVDDEMFGGHTVRLRPDGAQWQSPGGGGALKGDGLNWPLDEDHAIHKGGRADAKRPARGQGQPQAAPQGGLFSDVGTEAAGTEDMFTAHENDQQPPTPSEAGAPITKRSDKPLRRNEWGGASADSGEIVYHGDGQIGQAALALGDEAHLDVDGEPLANALGMIATDAVAGRTTTQEALNRVKAIRDRLPDGGKARAALDVAIANLDAPDTPQPAVPDGVPQPLRQLAATLHGVPTVRRDPGPDLDKLADILDRFAGGRLSAVRLLSEVRGLSNQRHESLEGKAEIDRAISKAVAELEALRRSDPGALRPGRQDSTPSPSTREDQPSTPTADPGKVVRGVKFGHAWEIDGVRSAVNFNTPEEAQAALDRYKQYRGNHAQRERATLPGQTPTSSSAGTLESGDIIDSPRWDVYGGQVERIDTYAGGTTVAVRKQDGKTVNMTMKGRDTEVARYTPDDARAFKAERDAPERAREKADLEGTRKAIQEERQAKLSEEAWAGEGEITEGNVRHAAAAVGIADADAMVAGNDKLPGLVHRHATAAANAGVTNDAAIRQWAIGAVVLADAAPYFSDSNDLNARAAAAAIAVDMAVERQGRTLDPEVAAGRDIARRILDGDANAGNGANAGDLEVAKLYLEQFAGVAAKAGNAKAIVRAGLARRAAPTMLERANRRAVDAPNAPERANTPDSDTTRVGADLPEEERVSLFDLRPGDTVRVPGRYDKYSDPLQVTAVSTAGRGEVRGTANGKNRKLSIQTGRDAYNILRSITPERRRELNDEAAAEGGVPVSAMDIQAGDHISFRKRVEDHVRDFLKGGTPPEDGGVVMLRGTVASVETRGGSREVTFESGSVAWEGENGESGTTSVWDNAVFVENDVVIRRDSDSRNVDTNRDRSATVSTTMGAPKTGRAPDSPGEGAPNERDERVRRDSPEALDEVPAPSTGGTGEPGRVLREARRESRGADRGTGRADGRGRESGRGVPGDSGQAQHGPAAGTRAGDGRGSVPAGRTRDGEPGLEPAAQGRFRPTSQQDLAPAGERNKARANVDAVKTLRAIQSGQRPATDAEKRVLARWSGWGAVPVIFEQRPELQNYPDEAAHGRALKRWETFSPERDELRAMLNDAEWAAASRNTLNAHYTDAGLVAAVWDAVKELGFDGGNVLEPGSGVGTFIGLAPDEAHMTGIELDPTTAAISGVLYPHAVVRNESFADTRVPDGSFDLAVGNVPFGQIALTDRDHNKGDHSIHNHFIIKSLALTRPGGLVAVITSRYTMDSESSKARQEMADMADLVGAVRLPSGAHLKAAGTDVVTDLLVFRKREQGEPARDTSWVDAQKMDVNGHQIPVNTYFAEHPEKILGEMTTGRGQFSAAELIVKGDRDAAPALKEALDGLVAEAKENGQTYTPPAGGEPSARLKLADRNQSHDGYVSVGKDGAFTRVVRGQVHTLDVHPAQREQLAAYLGLRDAVTAVLDEEEASATDTPRLRELRTELNRRYKDYAAKYDAVSKPRFKQFTPADATAAAKAEGRKVRDDEKLPTADGLFRRDPSSAFVYALDRWDPDTKKARPAHILSRRVVAVRKTVTRANSPADALAIVMDRNGGRVDLPEIAKLLAVDEAEARRQLGTTVFDEPGSGRFVPAAAYLSDDVREKLEIAREAAEEDPRFSANVAALEGVLPRDLTPGEIDARMGAPWIGPEVIAEFLSDLLGESVRVEHGGGSIWGVEAPSHTVLASSTWGTKKRPAGDIAQALLEQRTIKVTSTVTLPNGDKKSVPDPEGTLEAQQKAQEMAEKFSEWIWESPDRAERLARIYNDRFNNIVLRSYDGASPALPGLAAGWTPREHQKAAVARIVSEPSVLLAHEVGAGKTAEMVMGAMELRRTGLARKPAIVVPNHMLEQFTREFLELYPQANILAAGSSDLTGAKRREFVARAATGDWDAVILTQKAFEKIDMRPDAQKEYMEAELQKLRDRINRLKAKAAAEGKKPITLKRMEAALLRAEEKLKQKLDGKKDEGAVYFEQTGIDYLMVDEAHHYKNLRTVSNIEGAGIDGSGRASDLHMKLHYLRGKSESGRVVTLATGTPIANSVTEAYTMMRYLRPDLLDKTGLDDFDNWAATFGDVVTDVEMNPDGNGFRQKSRFAKFRNVPELLRMYRVSADVKTAADLNLPTPPVRKDANGNKGETVVIPASEDQLAYIQELGKRADDVRNGRVKPEEDNMLKISGDGKRAALDMRLIEPGADSAGGKIDVASDKIAEIYERTKDLEYPVSADDGAEMHPTRGALQIVFMDQGTPKPKGGGMPKKVKGVRTPVADLRVGDWIRDYGSGAAFRIVGISDDDYPYLKFDYEDKNGNTFSDRSLADDGSELEKIPEPGAVDPDAEAIVGDGDTSHWAAYDEMKAQLVARGIPENKIRYIHEANTDQQKAKLFEDARTGKIAVLIGSTEKMGTGTNVQARAVALHHMDCPWRPADLAQRDGRIERQGNLNTLVGDKDVRILRYVTEGTFDGYSWQTVERKAKFIAQMQRGSLDVREMEDVGDAALSFAEVKALAAGNPYLLEKAKADTDLNRLERLDRAHHRNQAGLAAQITSLGNDIEQTTGFIARWEEARKARTESRGDAFAINLGGDELTKRADAYQPLEDAARALRDTRPFVEGKRVVLGQLGGHDVIAETARETRSGSWYQVVRIGFDWPRGTTSYLPTDLGDGAGRGILRSLENRLDALDTQIDAGHTRIANMERERGRARAAVGKPFPQADKLVTARERSQLLGEIIATQAKRDEMKPAPGQEGSDGYKQAVAELVVLEAMLEANRPAQNADPASDPDPDIEPDLPDATPSVSTGDDGHAVPFVPDEDGQDREPALNAPAPAQGVTTSAPDDPAPEQVATPQMPEAERRIRDAYLKLAPRDSFGGTSWVSLTKLRESLTDLPRAEVDDMLRRMNRMPDINLVPESNQRALSAEDRAAAINIGDQDKHMILIEGAAPPSPEPAPAPVREPAPDGKVHADQAKPGDILDDAGQSMRVTDVNVTPDGVTISFDDGSTVDLDGADLLDKGSTPDTGDIGSEPQDEPDRPSGMVDAGTLRPGDRVTVVRDEGGVRGGPNAHRMAVRDTVTWTGAIPDGYTPGQPVRLADVVEREGAHPPRYIPDAAAVRLGDQVERLDDAAAAADVAEAASLRDSQETARVANADDMAARQRALLREAGGEGLADAVDAFQAAADAVYRGEAPVADGEAAWLTADAALAAAIDGTADRMQLAQLKTQRSNLASQLGRMGGDPQQARREQAERWQAAEQEATKVAEDGTPELVPVERVAPGDRVDTPAGETVTVEDVTTAGDVTFTTTRDSEDRRTIRASQSGNTVTKRTGRRKSPVIDEPTAGDVQVGEWLIEDGQPVQVVGVERDGDRVVFDVVGENGPALIDYDARETVTRGKGLRKKRERKPSQPREPRRPPTLEDGTPAGRVRLRTDIRKRVLALDIDGEDSTAGGEVREAAARLRASKPLSAAQMRALSQHVRSLAEDGERPAATRRALGRAADWIDASYARLSGYPEPPPNAERVGPERAYAENLVEGDAVALAEPDGSVTQARVVGVRALKGFPVVNVTVEHNDGRREQRILAAGVDVWLMPDLPPDVEVEPDVDDRREHIRLDRLEVGDAIAHTIRGRDGSEHRYAQIASITKTSKPFAARETYRVRLEVRHGDHGGVVAADVVTLSGAGNPSVVRTARGPLSRDQAWDAVLDTTGGDPIPVADMQLGDRVAVLQPQGVMEGTVEGLTPVHSDGGQVGVAATIRTLTDERELVSIIDGDGSEVIRHAGAADNSRVGVDVQMRRRAARDRQRHVAAVLADAETGLYRSAAASILAELDTKLVHPPGDGGMDVWATAGDIVEAAWKRLDPAASAAAAADAFGPDDDKQHEVLVKRLQPLVEQIHERAAENMIASILEVDPLPGESHDQALRGMISQFRDMPPMYAHIGRTLGRFDLNEITSGDGPEIPAIEGGDLGERMAAYRKALPDDLAHFGHRKVNRRVFAPLDLDQLNEAYTPELDTVTALVPDVADDGGPGEHAMRHLAIVKAAGADLDRAVQERLDSNPAYADAVAAAEAAKAAAEKAERSYAAAAAKVGRSKAPYELLEAARTTRSLRDAAVERALEIRRDAMLGVLRQVRGVGGDGLDYRGEQGFKQWDRSVPGEALRAAEAMFPSDWLHAVAERGPMAVRFGDRGSYDGGANTITFHPGEPAELRRISAHELGHAMEETIPGLREAQEAYLWERTSTGDVGDRTRPDLAEIEGRAGQVGYPDAFPQPYTGRVYDSGNREILATGMEDLMSGGGYLDDDHRQWLLGVLALLGTDTSGPRRDPLDGVDVASLSTGELQELLASLPWGSPAYKRVMAELAGRDREGDPLAGIDLDSLDVAELVALMGRVTDPYSLARLHEAADRRERADREQDAKDAKIDELVAGGVEFDQAWADVHGVSEVSMARQERQARLNDGRLPGESLDAMVARHYQGWQEAQWLAAQASTNGYLLNAEGRAAGIDPRSLFEGSWDRAQRYASEELRNWWTQHGWMNITEFRAQMLGRDRDVRAAKQSRQARGAVRERRTSGRRTR